MDEYTHPLGSTQEIAPGDPTNDGFSEENPVPSAVRSGLRRLPKRRDRRSKKPSFLKVEHRWLRFLGAPLSLALAAVAYRDRNGQSLDASTLAWWVEAHRSTAYRQLVALVDLGLITAEGRLTDRYHRYEGAKGHIKVDLKLMCEGALDAIALSLLPSWGLLGMVRFSKGWAEVRQTKFALFLGCSTKTVAALLDRLASGRTVGARRAIRRGVDRLIRPRLDLRKHQGRATYARMLHERVSAQRAEVGSSVSPPSTGAVHFPQDIPALEDLMAMGGLRTSSSAHPP